MDEKLTKANMIENLHNKLGIARSDIHEIIEFYHEFWGLWNAPPTFNNDGNMGTGTVPRFRHYYTTIAH